jgi:hypothetical protein
MNKLNLKSQISKIRIILILVSSFYFIFSNSADAAKIIFSPSNYKKLVGDKFTVDVMVDTQGQVDNALDLTILYPKLLEVQSVSKKSSVISLWINEPSFNGDAIFLTGGRPGGFKTGRGQIARITFKARAIGQGGLGLGPSSMVLINDGKGSSATLQLSKNTLSVLPRSKNKKAAEIDLALVAPEEDSRQDTQEPDKFQINISREPEIFDGKYFISFFTQDSAPDKNETSSGVDHYEIKEGEGVFKYAQSPYLLSDQSLHSVVRIRAYDVAGNWRESIYPGLFKRTWWWIIKVLSGH